MVILHIKVKMWMLLDKLEMGADINSAQYWENLYPGWKFDPNSGQWYQLHGCDGTTNELENVASFDGSVEGIFDVGVDSQRAVSDVQASQVSSAQQTVQSAIETVSQCSTTDNVSGLNHISLPNGEYQYPAHMTFDPQYPGWYYDTIAQQWCSLEAYHLSAESINQTQNSQQVQNVFPYTSDYLHDSSQGISSGALQGLSSGSLNQYWATSHGDYHEQGSSMMESWSAVASTGSKSLESSYDSFVNSNSHVDQLKSSGSREIMSSFDTTNQSLDNSKGLGESHSSVPADNSFLQFNRALQVDQNGLAQYPSAYYGSQNATSVPQPLYSNGHHIAYATSEGRSSVGRPPHALVTFGFGGEACCHERMLMDT